MANNNQTDFPPYKISKSFKFFITLFSIIALLFLGYILFKTGENLQDIISIITGAIGGIVLIVWLALVSIKKIRNKEGLSDRECLYIDDLGNSKIVNIIKKYIFSNMEIGDVLKFIIVMGYLFKWMFFGVFTFGTIIVFCRNDTFFSKILMLSLGIIWCPWLENLILKKLNYKIVFIIKILATFAIFCAGIIMIDKKGG
ncbi:MAG: hypothetical protein M0R48_08415 [Candidatus Omnitrophica bacterium]|jgi:hypothetical protein|nr:hypothetical protein [Candidatus Omnitrophota bacterium]